MDWTETGMGGEQISECWGGENNIREDSAWDGRADRSDNSLCWVTLVA